MIKTLPVLSFKANDIEADSPNVAMWVDHARERLQKVLNKAQSKIVGKFTIVSADVDGDKTFLVYVKETPVGVLNLQKNDDGVWAVDNIGIMSAYRGQNLGTVLYETALSDIGRLGSSTSLSGGSSKVWKALCLKHKGVFVIPEAYSRVGKPLEVKIKDWLLEGYITYPVFSKRDGSMASLLDLLSDGSSAAKNGYYLIKAFGSNSQVSEHWPFN